MLQVDRLPHLVLGWVLWGIGVLVAQVKAGVEGVA